MIKLHNKKVIRAQKQKNNRISWLRSKLVPVKIGKTQRVNTFLADPAAFSTEEPQQDAYNPQAASIQPWMGNYEANQKTSRQQRSIRFEINSMLGLSSDVTSQGNNVFSEAPRIDQRKITRKMKKYLPANSSFSLLYGEKRGIQKLKSKDVQSKSTSKSNLSPKFNLPFIPIKGLPHQENLLKKSKISKISGSNSANSLSKVISVQNPYTSQVKSIYQAGSGLRNFSQKLITKIDSASQLIDKNYQILGQKASQMIAGIGNYHLEEETDKSYKKNMFITPFRLLKK